ncbi:MAG: InlB B-repeat-containing protein [Oscillospiraceae bacterium]
MRGKKTWRIIALLIAVAIGISFIAGAALSEQDETPYANLLTIGLSSEDTGNIVLGESSGEGESTDESPNAPNAGDTEATDVVPLGASGLAAFSGSGVPPKALDLGENKVMGAGGGGALFNPLINPLNDNNILIGTDMSGTFVSRDGGDTFIQKNLLGSAKYSFNPHDHNIVYAYNSYIYVSYDGGENFSHFYPKPENVKAVQSGLQEGPSLQLYDKKQTPINTVFSLEVDPSDPNTIYFVTKGYFAKEGHSSNQPAGIYKTTDNGQTWNEIAQFPEKLFTNANEAVAGVAFTTNSVENYIKLYIDPNSPADNRTLMVLSSHGMFRVQDDGSGNVVQINDTHTRAADYYYDSATKQTYFYVIPSEVVTLNSGTKSYRGMDVLCSSDGGTTWSSIVGAVPGASSSPVDYRTYEGVAVNGDSMYVSFQAIAVDGFTPHYQSAIVAASHDGGGSWEFSMKSWDASNITRHNWAENINRAATQLQPDWNGVKNGLVVSKTNPNLVVSTGHMTGYNSSDGGQTWKDAAGDFDTQTLTSVSNGIDQVTGWDVDVDPFNSNHMFFSYSDIGLFESWDGGSSWKRSQMNGVPTQPYYANSCYAFEFDPDIPGFCLAGFAGRHDLNMGRNLLPIIAMANKGKTDPYAENGYPKGGVLRSTDGGQNFTKTGVLGSSPIRDDDGISGLPDHALVTDLVIDPMSPKVADQRVVYASCIGFGVYRSEDGGQTFQKYISGMEGETQQMPWRLIWTPDYQRLYVLFAPMGNVNSGDYDYHPDDGPVYYLDRGESVWKKIPSMPTEGMPPNRFSKDYVVAFNGLAVDSKGTIYAAGRAHYTPPDNGITDSTNYGGVWKSEDDGATWQNIFPPTANVYDVKVDSRNDDVLYICTTVGGEVLVSYKGAATTPDDWYKMDEFQHTVPLRVFEDGQDPDYMYVTTFGGGTWHLKLPSPVNQTSHSISYLGNGNSSGTAPTDAQSPYDKGNTVQIFGSGDLTKTGHIFDGWNTKEDGSGITYQEGDTFAILRDTVLYAKWKDPNAPVEDKHAVTYFGNGNTGGSAPTDSQSPYDKSSTVTVLGGSLVREGYLFDGWNSEPDGSGASYKAGESFVIDADKALYASWKEDNGTTPPFEAQFIVAYQGNGNTGGDPPTDSNSYSRGSSVTVLGSGSLVKNGYLFGGWNTRADGSGTGYSVGGSLAIEQDMTLYAVWTKAGSTMSSSSQEKTPSSGGTTKVDTSPTLQQGYVIDTAEMRALNAQAQAKGRSSILASSSLSATVKGNAWKLAGEKHFQFRSISGSAVQVQLTFSNPAKLTSDVKVSGSVKGASVESIKVIFGKWFPNKIQVVHLEQAGSFGQQVEIAAKVDLSDMSTKALAFYAYDVKSNTYMRIANPAYWIDRNGYLHFTTDLAGDIVISEGTLVKK